MTTSLGVPPATQVDHDAAIEACDRADGWMHLTLRALAAPCWAALHIEGADPVGCMAKLHAATKAVEECRESTLGLRRAFQRVRPHP